MAQRDGSRCSRFREGHATLENTGFYTEVASKTARAVTSALDRARPVHTLTGAAFQLRSLAHLA